VLWSFKKREARLTNPRIGSHSIGVACVLRKGPDTEIPGEICVHFGFWEANNLGREFDEGQTALLHQVVNRPLADVQAPRDLRLGFVIRRCGKFCSF